MSVFFLKSQGKEEVRVSGSCSILPSSGGSPSLPPVGSSEEVGTLWGCCFSEIFVHEEKILTSLLSNTQDSKSIPLPGGALRGAWATQEELTHS